MKYDVALPHGETTEKSLEELLSLSPYTILYFYPKNNTPWCTMEAKDFTELADEFEEKWVQIIGVSKDSIESHCGFINKHGLSNTFISDPEIKLHQQYNARWEKNTYGKKSIGVIRSTILLDKDGNTLHERHNVKATWHAQRVLTYVKENLE